MFILFPMAFIDSRDDYSKQTVQIINAQSEVVSINKIFNLKQWNNPAFSRSTKFELLQ